MIRRFFKGSNSVGEGDLVEVNSVDSDRSNTPIHFLIPTDPENKQEGTKKSISSGRATIDRNPNSGIHFYGSGDQLLLGSSKLMSPLVYSTAISNGGRFDASLLDTTLPVSSVSGGDSRLPYWPTYYDCSPWQRYKYRQWLCSDRKDPNLEIGYVFIYFYGLERRVLVDRMDHGPIADEIMRLLSIYSRPGPFYRYGSLLLWTTLYLANQVESFSVKQLSAAINATTEWNDNTLMTCLSILKSKSILLPSRLARVIAERRAKSSSSAVVNRYREEFERLFRIRYRQQFGNGLRMESAKELKRLDYYPASGSLLRFLHSSNQSGLPPLQDVLSVTKQFEPLVEIWDQAIESFSKYSVAKQKSKGKLSTEVYEAMPRELRDGQHPGDDQARLR